MSEIKRYYKQIFNTGLGEHKNGDFVKYTDHQAAIKQAKIDAVREFVHKAKMDYLKEYVGQGVQQWLSAFEDYHIEQLKEQGDAN